MNHLMIKQLIRKDLSLHRWIVMAYLLASVTSVLVASLAIKNAYYVGSILAISSVIALGMHLVIVAIVLERDNKTLAFVMSLPVTMKEYTVAKTVSVFGSYVAVWTAVALACAGAVLMTDHIPNGVLPYFACVLGYMLMTFALLFCVAMTTESLGWTIACLATSNVSLNFVMPYLGRLQEFESQNESQVLQWGSVSLQLITGELLLITLVLAIMFFLQWKKRDFT